MYIQRHVQNTIQKNAEQFSVILVTGPRQVGKSTMLREQLPDLEYITLDDRIVQNSLKTDPVGFFKSFDKPIIIDEIQRSPDCFIDIKYIVDKTPEKKGLFFLSGSQRYQLMKGVSESLAGRIGVVDMLGLSMREINGDSFDEEFLPTDVYLQIRKKNKQTVDTSRNIWKTIHRGSMPELCAHETYDWENYYSSYVSTYVERDVREILNISNTLAFVSFLTALAARTGELLNLHSLAVDAGIDDKTAKNWLSVLCTSGLVYLLQPFSLNITKRAIKTPKVYFMDTGIVCYLCRWLTPETLEKGAQAGNIFETFVISEILKSYMNQGRDAGIYYFRTTNGQEIDLIFHRGNTLYPVEIKKSASPDIKMVKNFNILKTYFPQMEIGTGGLICNYDQILPLNEKNNIIPVDVI